MRKVRKLTPATLKRIIAEEKARLGKSSQKKKKLSNEQLVERYIKALSLLRASQSQKNRESRKINEVRKLIKKRLLKRL
tara:strand:- start:181 stop:417 length:237 start_codon:yes stop_codon:yes gene_type:complete